MTLDGPKIRRVLVCGGRSFNNYDAVFKRLDQLNKMRGPFEAVIHGAAKGADRIAGLWAIKNRVIQEQFPAKWSDLSAPGADIRVGVYGEYNANAGTDRNQLMIDVGKPDAVVAFPGGSGTADMVRRAHLAKIEVIRCKP